LHDDAVKGAVFSTDEARILTWSEDDNARLWDAATSTQIGPAVLHPRPPGEFDAYSYPAGWNAVFGAVLSNSDTRILTWNYDNAARLWDASTGAQIGPALQHEGSVRGGVFSKDDTQILTWSYDATARLWDAATGTQIGPALKHEYDVKGAIFSKDETRILTWDSYSARLWDATTGSSIGPTFLHNGHVADAAFLSDEAHIITWSEQHTARLWDVHRAMWTKPDGTAITDVCKTNLRGSLALDNRDRMSPFPSLIDAKVIEAAPILRGREGEDVCTNPTRPWWDAPLLRVVNLLGIP
jgi:WD40 repeat protein